MKKIFITLELVCFFATAEAMPQQDSEFDFLALAQFWPPTSCYIHYGRQCEGIPPGIDGFTIHGLWPSRPGKEQPEFCNKTDKFDYTKIEALSHQLALQWPNFDTKADEKDFLWSHEWERHGTCAATLPALRGEFNYFQKTLQVQKGLNVTGALSKRGIVPSSTKPYKAQELFNALAAFYGVNPIIACESHDGKDLSYLQEVLLCFTKDFELMSCPEDQTRTNRGPSYPHCPQQGKTKVLYLPIKTDQAQKSERVMHFRSERFELERNAD